jgi:hypothetical protein
MSLMCLRPRAFVDNGTAQGVNLRHCRYVIRSDIHSGFKILVDANDLFSERIKIRFKDCHDFQESVVLAK